jgi:hypothetical protein
MRPYTATRDCPVGPNMGRATYLALPVGSRRADTLQQPQRLADVASHHPLPSGEYLTEGRLETSRLRPLVGKRQC